MRVLMFANGIIEDYSFIQKYLFDYNLILCADGGLRHIDAVRANCAIELKPDYIMGDFDSATPELLEKYKKPGVSFVQFPSEKDFTDLEAGLRFAIEKGASNIIIFGATGGRLDHELCNINLLYLALLNGVEARIVTETQVIRMSAGEIELTGRAGKLISLMPFGGAVSGITTCGLDYPLSNEKLDLFETRGISNVMTGNIARVSHKAGIMLVVEN